MKHFNRIALAQTPLYFTYLLVFIILFMNFKVSANDKTPSYKSPMAFIFTNDVDAKPIIGIVNAYLDASTCSFTLTAALLGYDNAGNPVSFPGATISAHGAGSAGAF